MKKSFFYIPACAKMTDDLANRIKGSEMFYLMEPCGKMMKWPSKVGEKTGQRMGHMNNSGDDGSIEAFKDLNVKKKFLSI